MCSFTGDSFANWGLDDYCANNRCFVGREVGFDRRLRTLLETKPDILVAAHTGPLPVTAEYLQKTRALLRERETLYQPLFPRDDPNFAIDPRWISLYPYRQMALPGAAVEIEARVMNHSAAAKVVRVDLRLPAGWEPRKTRGTTQLPAKTERRIRLSAVAPAKPARRRHVIGLSAVVGGRLLDEIGEAMADFQA